MPETNLPTLPLRPTPRPPQATPAPGAASTLVRPAADTVVVHNVNRTIFHVVSTLEESGGITVAYARFGDGRGWNLSLPAFWARYRLATSEELTVLHRVLPIFTSQGQAVELNRAQVVCDQLDEQQAAGATENAESQVIQLPPRAPRNGRNAQEPADESNQEVGALEEPTELNDFNRLILFEDAIRSIFAGLRSIARRDDMERIWQLSRITNKKGSVLLMYGPSGTGKTESALCIARHLNKKLYKVKYSQIISKYDGDTAKHITAIFKKCLEHDAIPFLDEADSICSRRISMENSGATHINQNRNTLMQEMDAYAVTSGLPILMTTNLYVNFDPALVRRINRAIKFDLPDEGMRRRILDVQFPTQNRFSEGVSLDLVAAATGGFSGGNLLQVTLAAIESASEDDNEDNWAITQEILDREIASVRASILGNSTADRSSIIEVRPAVPHAPGDPVVPVSPIEEGGFVIPA